MLIYYRADIHRMDRGEEGSRHHTKQSVTESRGIPDDAAHPPQTPLVPDRLSGGEWGTGDALGSFFYPAAVLFSQSSGHTILRCIW